MHMKKAILMQNGTSHIFQFCVKLTNKFRQKILRLMYIFKEISQPYVKTI